jgi:hypothetical protein
MSGLLHFIVVAAFGAFCFGCGYLIAFNRCRISRNTLKKPQAPPTMLVRPSKATRQMRIVSKLSAPAGNRYYASSRRLCCGRVLNYS